MQERTYGIEIECFTNIGKYTLAEKIKTALHEAGFTTHEVICTGYHHNTDSTNFTVWELKRDGSLHRNSLHADYEGVECVSPVLIGEDGLKALKAVTAVITTHCKVNISCGLHVHHGVNYLEMQKISKAWIKAESLVLMALPRSRRNNNYSRPWSLYPTQQADITYIDRISQIRMLSLNLSSYGLRKTVEFRCGAGTTEYEKVAGWLLFTQGMVEKASRTDIDGLDSLQFSTIEEIADFVKDGDNGTTADHRSKYRNGSLRLQLVEFLESGPKTREEITIQFGKSLPKARKVMLDNGTIVKDGPRYSLAGGNSDPEYVLGADVIVSRYNFFNNEVRRAA